MCGRNQKATLTSQSSPATCSNEGVPTLDEKFLPSQRAVTLSSSLLHSNGVKTYHILSGSLPPYVYPEEYGLQKTCGQGQNVWQRPGPWPECERGLRDQALSVSAMENWLAFQDRSVNFIASCTCFIHHHWLFFSTTGNSRMQTSSSTSKFRRKAMKCGVEERLISI